MIGELGRFEILERTLASELPYVTVIGGWHDYEGAFALAWQYAIQTYDFVWLVEAEDNTIHVKNVETADTVATIWVWENPDG